MKDVYLHNPRCSKSRGGLDLLREKNVDIPVREYLKDTPTESELRDIVRLLGVRPIDIVRKGEEEYRELGLNASTPDDQVLKAMVEHPILIERPILVHNGRAVVGRPTEKLLEILS